MSRPKDRDRLPGPPGRPAPREGQRSAVPVRRITPSGQESVAQPLVTEDASDSAWDRFEALLNADKTEFDSTQSSLHVPLNNQDWSPTRPGALPPEPKWRLQLEADVNEVLTLARSRNRAAPVPAIWEELYRLLPGAEHRGRSDGAPPPLPTEHSSPMQRRLRLRDQIEWAEVRGVLREVHAFLSLLPEQDWTHFDA